MTDHEATCSAAGIFMVYLVECKIRGEVFLFTECHRLGLMLAEKIHPGMVRREYILCYTMNDGNVSAIQYK